MIYILQIDNTENVEKIKSMKDIVILEHFEKNGREDAEMAVYITCPYDVNDAEKTEKAKKIIKELKECTVMCENIRNMLTTAEVKPAIKSGVYNIVIKKSLFDNIIDKCIVIEKVAELDTTYDTDLIIKIYISNRLNVDKVREWCDKFTFDVTVKN